MWLLTLSLSLSVLPWLRKEAISARLLAAGTPMALAAALSRRAFSCGRAFHAHSTRVLQRSPVGDCARLDEVRTAQL